MKNEELEEIKKEKRVYMKEWRKRNTERIKIHNQRYWLKRIEKRMIKEGEIKNDNK